MKEKALNGKTPITRRDFLGGGVAGVGGLLIGTPLAWGGSFTQRMIQNSPPGSGPMAEINAWIHIRTDSEIHFILDKAEMGQGVITGLTAVVAEELDVSPFDIKVDFAPPGSEYGNPKMFGAQITGGSTSVASSFDRLRQAAADARALLVAAASEELKVKAAECSVSKNNHSYFISDSKSNKRVSFGDVAEKAAEINKTMARSLNPIKGVPKPRSQYKILGQPQNQPKPLRRYDAWAKITGRATYGIDVGPEQTGSTEMLHCAVIRCPVAGGKLTQFSPRNPTELGVTQLVPLKGGLAVVAPTFWEALSASKKIKVKWNAGALAQQSTEKFSAAFRNTSQKRGVVACVESALTSYEKMEAALNNSNHQIDATFEVPYVPHATMEPMNCTVHFKGASCDIWVPTQAPAAAREIARQITGLDHAHINVNSTFLGGGFRTLWPRRCKSLLIFIKNLALTRL